MLEHVYMRPEVNSNRFETSHRFEISFRLQISLRQLFKQWQASIAHVQILINAKHVALLVAF